MNQDTVIRAKVVHKNFVFKILCINIFDSPPLHSLLMSPRISDPVLSSLAKVLGGKHSNAPPSSRGWDMTFFLWHTNATIQPSP